MKKLLPTMAFVLTACGGGGGGGDDGPSAAKDVAVIAARAPDYSSGAVSTVEADAPYTAQNNLNATISDIAVRSGGDHYFLIERFGTDRISRYEAGAPETRTYRYSTQDATDSDSSNPYDLIVASPTKGYLIRYGSPKLWIVNPAATTEATFKTGEIDLSAYDAFDGVPEMCAGIIRDGKLYVAMQRLENFNSVKSAYVAVFDVATDEEITTGADDAPLKGIELPVRGPSALAATPGGDIMVVASGGYDDSFNPLYDGGIARIDHTTYETSLILDDGDPTSHPLGLLTAMAIADDDRGYLIGSTGFFGTQTVYRFAPSGGSAPVTVSGFAGGQYGALAMAPDGALWVGLNDDAAPGVAILGFSGGTETVLASRVDTGLTPINIDFVTAEVP